MIRPLLLALLFSLTSTGCDLGPSSPRGFSLPLGDKVNGELVFKTYQCLACHTLAGFEQETADKELAVPVALGGTVTQIVTYAELVTSIINPSHKFPDNVNLERVQTDGVSNMRNYNDVMTISQLIDLVTFLQPHYELVAYETTYYTNYH